MRQLSLMFCLMWMIRGHVSFLISLWSWLVNNFIGWPWTLLNSRCLRIRRRFVLFVFGRRRNASCYVESCIYTSRRLCCLTTFYCLVIFSSRRHILRLSNSVPIASCGCMHNFTLIFGSSSKIVTATFTLNSFNIRAIDQPCLVWWHRLSELLIALSDAIVTCQVAHTGRTWFICHNLLALTWLIVAALLCDLMQWIQMVLMVL